MSLTDAERIQVFTNLARAVAFDRMMMRVIHAGKMVGFYHEGGIALAPGVAAGSFLRKDDVLWPHYRAHGMAHMLSKGIDLAPYVAEHMGREGGCCKGRSSFHFSFPEHHVFGYSGNVGANFPASVGYGYAARFKRAGQVVMSCSGDGSYGEGRAHEALVMAANWKLPVVFWCENNGVAQYSALSDIFPGPQVSSLAAGYGIPALVVDGQDLFAAAEAAKTAVEHCRSGEGPIFVELMTLRAQEHNVGGLNHEGVEPRSPELMDDWKRNRDPLVLAAARLMGEKVLDADAIDAIRREAADEAAAAEARAETSPRAEPAIAELTAGVYAA